MIPELVVDASVGIKLFIDEELSDRAEKLFQALVEETPSHFYVPDLFYIECTNILWKSIRRFGYPAEDARQDVVALTALSLTVISTSVLLPGALDLATRSGVSAYDACYAALAQSLEIPFVTADRKLIGKLEDSGAKVLWLGDLPL